LTPVAIWVGWRFPIGAKNWRSRVPLHLAISFTLATAQLSLEAYLGWLRHHHGLSAEHALKHYFSQHTQISLLTYWLIVGGTHLYRVMERARHERLRSARLETRLSAARLAMLRRQLQPHFLFNTLQAATTLVHDDPGRAEEILLRLSDLLRVSLDDFEQQEIPLERELEILEHYTAIQMCRFQDRLRFEIHVKEEVQACAVPCFLLQPLVENAVRHGVGAHKESDVVTIRGSRQGRWLQLSVCNLTSELQQPAEELFSRGIGLSTTRQRLRELYGESHSWITLKGLKPRGVDAEIVLPFRIMNTEEELATAKG
jgi:LytS/YehU family sensor histidine kinase